MSRGSQPSFDYLSVAVSVPADATRPYAGIFADPPKAHKHLAKLTPQMPKGASSTRVGADASASSSPAWRHCITPSRSSGAGTAQLIP